MRGMFNPARPWNNVDGIPVGGVVFAAGNPDADSYVQPTGQKYRVPDYPGLSEAGFMSSPYGMPTAVTLNNVGIRKVRRTGRDASEFVSVGRSGDANYSTDRGATWSLIWDRPTDAQIRSLHAKVFGPSIHNGDIIWDAVSSNYILFLWSVCWNADNSYTIGVTRWRTATLGGAWTSIGFTTSGAQNQVNLNQNVSMSVEQMPDGSTVFCDGFSRIYRAAAGVSLANNAPGFSLVTTMIRIDTANSSNLYMCRSDSDELLIYNSGKATYRTSTDNGVTWANRTFPFNIQRVQYGPLGWFIIPARGWASARITTNHVTFTGVPTITPTDELAGKTITSLYIENIIYKTDPDAPTMYFARAQFSAEATQYVLFSNDLVSWTFEPVVPAPNSQITVGYGTDKLWLSDGAVSAPIVSMLYGPYVTLPTLSPTHRGSSPFMKVK